MMMRFWLLVLLSIVSAGASAARSAMVYVDRPIGVSVLLNPMACDTLNTVGIDKMHPFSCDGLDEALKSSSGGQFKVTSANGLSATASVTMSGVCVQGRDAGRVDDIPIAYTKEGNTSLVLQTIQNSVGLKAKMNGCVVVGVEEGGCMWYSPQNGAQLKVCLVYFEETGELAGEDDPPDQDAPPFSGGGSGTGGGSGGGDTGTGGGTGGSGGTGGTGGSGGTGGTGGGTGGSGGSGGGTGGSGGSGGGSGGTGGSGGSGGGSGGSGGGGGTGGSGGSGGDGQQNCGAPGQPACRIDETGTPDGKGLFDDLIKMVEGIGSDREKGLEDAKSDKDKDTSLPLSVSLPSASCVNPTVTLPFIPGSWTVDICTWIAPLAGMFEAFWYLAFAFGVMAMVSRATAKPVA